MRTFAIVSSLALAAGFAPAPMAPLRTSSRVAMSQMDPISSVGQPVDPDANAESPCRSMEGICAPMGYFDPLNMAPMDESMAIWYRAAELKHGRVAMFAFIGFVAQSFGAKLPFPITTDGGMMSDGPTNPLQAWDAIPQAGRIQLIFFVGFLEFWGEAANEKHYLKGGKVGAFAPFSDRIPFHKIPSLWDPLGATKKWTEEVKARKRLIELNNGRLAMIGIMSLVANGIVEGSVPALEFMGPYSGGLPFAPLA